MDTNVLVYAADRSASEHAACRKRLEEWRRQRVPWHLTWSIVYEFLRVTTHPRVFRRPWSLTSAWTFVAALRASPSLTILGEGDQHAEALEEIVQRVPDLRGNVVHDAHIVALMEEHGIRVIWTRDTAFHRFQGIEVRDPLGR